MSEFTIRSESVDVDQIMKQIRARIAEKRGADYTEDQIRELASVRLEKFLDPKNLRSDLLEQFRKSRPAVWDPIAPPPPIEPPYTFDDQTLFASHRGILRLARRWLRPLLKLFFNPNTLNQILHTQAQFNVDMLKRDARRRVEQQQFDRSRAEWNALYYEVLHNLVLETTRTGIEVQNLRMRVESLSSRLDFSERRVRALEGVVQYRPEVVRGRDRREGPPAEAAAGSSTEGAIAEGYVPATGPTGAPGGALGDLTRRRRRRRRGRRGGMQEGPGGPGRPPGAGPAPAGNATDEAAEAGDDRLETGDEAGDGAGHTPESHDEPHGPSDDDSQ